MQARAQRLSEARQPAPKTPQGRTEALTSATLFGRVMAKQSGHALAGASILAIDERGTRVRTVSDSSGSFRIERLPAGRYRVEASRAGFLVGGANDPTSAAPAYVKLEPGVTESISIYLRREGSISGGVTDITGAPVVEATVTAYKRLFIGGVPRLMPAAKPTLTDDRGEYRVYGLRPGTYYLWAVPNYELARKSRLDRESSILPGFFPSAHDLLEAAAIRVEPEQDVTGGWIALRSGLLATVSGFAVPAQGYSRPELSLSRLGVFGASQSGRVTDKGDFVFASVAPGRYLLTAVWTAVSDASNEPLNCSYELAVEGEDVSGIVVEPTPPVKVRGTVSFHTDQGEVPTGAIQFVAVPVTTGAEASSDRAVVDANHNFRMNLPYGVSALRCVCPSGWYVESVTVGRADGTATIRVDNSFENARGLRVALTNRSGRILIRSDRIADNVLVLPEKRELWHLIPPALGGLAHATGTGELDSGPLVAGKYLLVQLDDDVVPGDRGELERSAAKGVPVVLEAGAEVTVQLPANGR